jgi:LPS-assembly protein
MREVGDNYNQGDMRKPLVPADSRRRRVLSSMCAGLLAAQGAAAASPDPAPSQGSQCQAALTPDPRLEELRQADPDDPRINITSDTGELGREGDATLRGNVSIRMGQRLLKADEAQIDATKRSVNLSGRVEYLDPQLHVVGTGGSFEGEGKGAGEFQGAKFELLDRSVRGAARDARLLENGTIDLTGVRYTACPPGNEDWEIKAGRIAIDQNRRVGTGRDVRLDFLGVPIFYAPWLSFPVGDERKSGLLFPMIGSSSKTGTQIGVPWYWNIAPNYDATLIGHYYSLRGLRIDPEFRYVTERSRGMLNGQYLHHDDVTGDSRSLVEFRHVTRVEPQTRLLIDAANVSDGNYFEDFGVGFEGTSITFLNRLAELRRDTEHWSILARTQDYQVVDDRLADADRPYAILPQVRADGHWRNLPGGLSAAFLADATNFQRNAGPQGVRVETEPSLEWRTDRSGAFLAAGAAWNYTQYVLNDVNGGATSPTRSAPIASLDGGFVLERSAGASGRRVQTLEPRLLYLYVPYRNQDDLPVFDTGAPDLNLVELFRSNRYVGSDRLGDANQISVGVTTRLLDAERGRQYLSATLGQAFYFDRPRVRLPNEPAADRAASDIVAELELAAFRNWNASFGYQWNPDQTRTERSEVFVQYKPASDRIVNLGYRFRRDLLEQFDASAAWPINAQWRGFARWVYSISEQKSLDQFVGVEYSSCCWAVRLISRRFVSSRSGASDTSFGLQLELKGLSSVGVDDEAFLRGAIRGYSALPSDTRS